MTDSTQKILVVDDEPQILKVLQAYFEKEGYLVVTSMDGRVALEVFNRENPTFVILDLNLPGMDGLDVCREIRRNSTVPILMLTARVEEVDKLIGLELGADDYVVKPFSPREVVARIKTIMKRVNAGTVKGEIIQAGNLTVDLGQHTVNLAGRLIELDAHRISNSGNACKQPQTCFFKTTNYGTCPGGCL